MTDLKTIKHLNCSLDFTLTHLLPVWVMSSTNAFWRRWFFFHWRFDDIDVESASKYVARKHRILIFTLWWFCFFPLHRSDIYPSSQNWRQDLFQMWKLYRRPRTPSWLNSISGVIRILMRVIRLTNGKPCRCYYTCGYMIFMSWVISLNEIKVRI